MDGEPPAVYVVDDDASVLLSLKRLLSGFGFEVFSYLTAEGFLQDHETGRDGCVILDLMMPGIGGLRLQEKLAACGRPIIFQSRHGYLSSCFLAMKAGAVAFLTKPFLLEERRALYSTAINLAIEA